MKILFVGVFHNKWSTNIPMVHELKNLGHKVVCFDFRYKQNNNAKNNNIKNSHYKSSINNYCSTFFKKISKLNQKYRNKISFFRILSEFERYYLYGRWKVNKQLINEVKKKKYDLIFLSKSDRINYKLIPKINKYGKTWYFFMDPLNVAIEFNAEKYSSLCNYSSATFSTIYSLFKRKQKNSYFITQGLDIKKFYPKKRKKEIDVIFIGTKTIKREIYIKYLKNNGISATTFGKDWNLAPVYLDTLVNLYRSSRIILNFTKGKYGFSIRVFQAMGTGSFLLTEYCKDLELFFKKKEHLDWFNTKKELLNKIEYYLKNKDLRENIAYKGMNFVVKNYNWNIIMKRIVNIIEK